MDESSFIESITSLQRRSFARETELVDLIKHLERTLGNIHLEAARRSVGHPPKLSIFDESKAAMETIIDTMKYIYDIEENKDE